MGNGQAVSILTGQTDVWVMDHGVFASNVSLGPHPTGYNVIGIGHTGSSATVLFQSSSTGDIDEWVVGNGAWTRSIDLGVHPGAGWVVGGLGDFNGDHTTDLLWHNLLA